MAMPARFNSVLRDFRGGVRVPPPQPRIQIGNDGHYHFQGSPVIVRGIDYGHELFWQPGDAALFKAMGANAVRFVNRAWSPPVGDGKGDAYDATSPIGGFLNIQYFNTICAAIIEAKLAGMFVGLGFDSNCGQTERSDPNCQIDGAPSTFWLPSGRQRLLNHAAAERSYLTALPGWIDWIEPVIEPHPTVTFPFGQGTAFDDRDVMEVQEFLMQNAMAVDPGINFLIGGLSYFRNRFATPARFMRWEWVKRGNVAWTCNMLDGAITVDLPTLTAIVQTIQAWRKLTGRPFNTQQLGARTTDDPTYAFENQAYLLFSNPPPLPGDSTGGGSLDYTKWEGVGDTGQNYAPFQQADVNSPRLPPDTARIASMTYGYNLPRLYS